jgi:hypothetical protein
MPWQDGTLFLPGLITTVFLNFVRLAKFEDVYDEGPRQSSIRGYLKA